MHCCWTVCVIRLVLTVFVCTSVVCAASTPVQGDDALPPSPSTIPNPTSTEDTLTERAKNPNKTGNRKAKGGTKAMTGGAGSGTLSQLFPVQGPGPKWTTLDGTPGALPLSDATLRPHHAAKGVQHKYGAYDGKSCLKSHYPAGSWNLKGNPKGGISFYAPGPANVNLEKAKEAIFSYSVLFPPGFAFVKGGKLPGFYGGDDQASATGCSGGRRAAKCFSSRLMWRTGGMGEMYTYLPPYTNAPFKANQKICTLKNSECNPKYGASIMRGSFKFQPGKWTTVAQRIKLNTPGNADGELELFVDGKSTIKVTGVILTASNKGRIRGLFMQSFFGGSTKEWASPKDQDVYFSNLSVQILKPLGGA